eukprot:8070859-Pyramimonas_sp.AAC.1
MGFIQKLMCGDDRITKTDCARSYQALVASSDTLVSCELKVPLTAFARFWEVLLMSEPSSMKQVLIQAVNSAASPMKGDGVAASAPPAAAAASAPPPPQLALTDSTTSRMVAP